MGFRLVPEAMTLNGVTTAGVRYLCGSWASCCTWSETETRAESLMQSATASSEPSRELSYGTCRTMTLRSGRSPGRHSLRAINDLSLRIVFRAEMCLVIFFISCFIWVSVYVWPRKTAAMRYDRPTEWPSALSFWKVEPRCGASRGFSATDCWATLLTWMLATASDWFRRIR